MSRAQLIKSLIKGTGISEDAVLDKYLMSRGINPKFATKDQKVSHSKTGAFITWKNSRMIEDTLEERVDKKDTVTLDIPLLIRVLELSREDIKTDMDLHRVVEKLINIRNKGMLTMKDYNYIAKIHEEIFSENHIAVAMGKEMDDEGSMIMNQLDQMDRSINMMRGVVKDPNMQIPAWVQSKVTLAADYIETVASYMSSKTEEVEQVDEEVKDEYARKVNKYLKKKHNKEKVELDELTKSTLGKYVNKARSDRMDALHSSYRNADDNYEADEKDNKRVEKRDRGINLARAKINKFGKSGNTFAKVKATEEVEQVDELSSDLLGRYKTGASKQASELDKVGNIKKADSRFRGIVKATKKQFDNDLKKEASSPAQQAAIAIAMKKAGKKPMNETLEEGRPSQRHPLEGHDYHKKTDDELVYIAKDAHKAADAMKSHNTSAENKYRDQANDSATVRYFRQKNGMPDWYKKKYGHVKESVEVLDGEEMQASEIIDNIQESRKKAIVREALKDAKDRMEKKGKKEEKKDAVGGKGDKFEAEPQMTSLVNDKQ